MFNPAEYVQQPNFINLRQSQLHSVLNGIEVEQTAAILYYCMYHSECIIDYINNTMNEKTHTFYNALMHVRDIAFQVLIQKFEGADIAAMEPKVRLDYLAKFMPRMPLPSSLSCGAAFMGNIMSFAMRLDYIYLDWNALKTKIVLPSDQVSMLIDSCYKPFMELYSSYPQIVLEKELEEVMTSNGISITPEMKCYFRICIIAAQLQVDCLSRGLLQLVFFVKDTQPVYCLDTVETFIYSLFDAKVQPPAKERATELFLKKIAEIVKVLIEKNDYSIVCLEAVAQDNQYVKTSIKNAFVEMDFLLNYVPRLKETFNETVQKGLVLMDGAKPATGEFCKVCVPFCDSFISAMDIYNMIAAEKSNFIGTPTVFMVKRWVVSLVNVITFLKSNHRTSHFLYKDANDLADSLLKVLQA